MKRQLRVGQFWVRLNLERTATDRTTEDRTVLGKIYLEKTAAGKTTVDLIVFGKARPGKDN